MTEPLIFGGPDRVLFGLHQRPGAEARGTAVLLCNAFGQEAIRAHRMYRVLAERVARTGIDVLRFDYFGTGDSDGEDRDGDLEGWTRDVLTAHRELVSRSGASRVVWIGMRLGGLVAMRAAATAPPELRRVVAWDPVIDGTAYLAHLRERHVATLVDSYSLPQRPDPLLVARDPAAYADEAIGFGLSIAMREQLRATALTSGLPPLAPELVVVCNPATAEGTAVERACRATVGGGGGLRVALLEHVTDWTTDEADNTSLVPTQALMLLAREAAP